MDITRHLYNSTRPPPDRKQQPAHLKRTDCACGFVTCGHRVVEGPWARSVSRSPPTDFCPQHQMKCPLPAVSPRQQLHTVVNQPQEASGVTHPSQADWLEVHFLYEIDICTLCVAFRVGFIFSTPAQRSFYIQVSVLGLSRYWNFQLDTNTQENIWYSIPFLILQG